MDSRNGNGVVSTWPQRFRVSLDRYKASGSFLAPPRDIAEAVSPHLGSPGTDIDHVIRRAVDIRAAQAADAFARDLAAGQAMCESPIEVVMLAALAIAGDRLDEVLVDTPGSWWRRPTRPWSLTIKPQARIGKYRADFLLTGRCAGEEYALVVECDGFDFHDRTPEQARRDRQRDRALQIAGYPVFRYAGSEIWRDVFAGAHQAVKAVVDGLGGDGID